MPPALEMRDVTKTFPGVVANDRVSFTLEKGEIHALLGENGAGKTTLMNVLYGLYHPENGAIHLNGREARITSPSSAIAHGIGMVHQHFMLVPTLTVAENIILGAETTKRGVLLDLKTCEQRVRELSQQYGLDIDPRAYIKDLPVGIQQRVEIVKALYREADILILDEPTAVLRPQEAEELFAIMKSLAARGKSIVFITHKLKEVFAVANRITVLRGGRVVGTTTPAETSEAELAAMMVGRPVLLRIEKRPAQPGEAVLRVENLVVQSDRRTTAVDGVSFNVCAGELLGIAGVEGNGQTELVEALTQLRPIADGRFYIGGRDLTHSSPRQVTEAGVAHVPEDRHKYGLVMSYPICDNLILNTYYKPPFAHGIVIDQRQVAEMADRIIREFDVRTPSSQSLASTLSGGNQQKVVVAREFSRPIKLLIAAQPTRGLDVGSIEFIHQKVVEARDAGVAVLLVSAELDEIMSLSDRIAVLFKGRIVDIVAAETATREQLGLLMAGFGGELTRVSHSLSGS
ncbi:MAG: ABC transporter ATP-binding protein [Chloroflexota bacterium]